MAQWWVQGSGGCKDDTAEDARDEVVDAAKNAPGMIIFARVRPKCRSGVATTDELYGVEVSALATTADVIEGLRDMRVIRGAVSLEYQGALVDGLLADTGISAQSTVCVIPRQLTRQEEWELKETDRSGMTQLHRAAKAGDTLAIERLALKGADLEQGHKEQYNWTALHWAARKGHIEAMRMLLQHGAQVDSLDDDGDTPLYTAVTGGQLQSCAFCIEGGADLSIVNRHGNTALHRAVRLGHIALARILLQNGARAVADVLGRTPADLAQNTHTACPLRSTMLSVLREYGHFPTVDTSSDESSD